MADLLAERVRATIEATLAENDAMSLGFIGFVSYTRIVEDENLDCWAAICDRSMSTITRIGMTRLVAMIEDDLIDSLLTFEDG
jgi:hypothetical protein